MRIKKEILFVLFICSIWQLKAQEKMNFKVEYEGVITEMEYVQPISSRKELVPSQTKQVQMMDGRASGNIVVPQKDPQTENDFFSLNPNPLAGKLLGKKPDFIFDAFSSNSMPTDPTLAVGPNHVFVTFNTGFIIYDKKGNALTGQISPNPTIFPKSGCCDMTISYDNQADRWVISFLGDGAQVAVSAGPDPINNGWYVYDIPQIMDYQKLSIWSDGYYMTDNTSATNKIWVLERDQMLLGNPSAKIVGFDLPGIKKNGFYSPQFLNVSNNDMPSRGNAPVVFLQDDAWAGVTNDHIKLWLVNVDWTNTANSTISFPQEISTTPFISVFDNGNFSNLKQLNGGVDIDVLQSAIMKQAQFRKFTTHNSAVFNFVVDTDASNGELAGIRWVELRQEGDDKPWSLYQEGTYTAPEGRHAWNASIMMDSKGNMGMGYTSMSGPQTVNTTYVSSYYTGRFAGDPLGTMTIAEELIAAGNANIPSIRFGDYSKIDIDPVDDKSFWYINEYMNNGRKGVVAMFQIAPVFNNDVGIATLINPVDGTLSSDETIRISIFNYGKNIVTNFPVSFQIDNGIVVTETYTGSVDPASFSTYTFNTKANLSTVGKKYNIKTFTSLIGDEDPLNDSKTTVVTHLFPNDLGIIAIHSPMSGSDLTASETIKVTLKNFGGFAQSNFTISYILNGTIVDEIFPGTIGPNSIVNYTFTQKADFYNLGTYYLSCYTNLPNDSDTSNDAYSTIIVKKTCEPYSNCDLGDEIVLFKLGDINNISGCGENGYSDFTNLKTDLATNAQYDLTVKTSASSHFISVWIDFNDNFLFENEERLITNMAITNESSESFWEIIELALPLNAPMGEHLLRTKINWEEPVPDDACESTVYGETEDYTINVFNGLLLGLENAEMIVKNYGDNFFEILLETSYKKPVDFTVYNILGQQLVFHRLRNEGIKFEYPLDMSYSAPGIYLVRMGNSEFGKVKKIIVN